tara:strand:+ start:245 stop:553 length:309 start_codon:yes stop_codon:yes gene_type:complete
MCYQSSEYRRHNDRPKGGSQRYQKEYKRIYVLFHMPSPCMATATFTNSITNSFAGSFFSHRRHTERPYRKHLIIEPVGDMTQTTVTGYAGLIVALMPRNVAN